MKKVNLENSIEELELPRLVTIRINAALRRMDINTISELCQQTAEILVTFRGIGGATVTTIEAALAEHGLRLGMTRDDLIKYASALESPSKSDSEEAQSIYAQLNEELKFINPDDSEILELKESIEEVKSLLRNKFAGKKFCIAIILHFFGDRLLQNLVEFTDLYLEARREVGNNTN